MNVIKGRKTQQTRKEMMIMTNAKVTNKSALIYAIENLPNAPEDIRAKWNKMIEQLDKKNAAPQKLTAHQLENENVKTMIVDFLAENKDNGYTITDLLKSVPALAEDSNQHVSALMRQLVENKAVIRYTEKRRTYFKIAE